MERRVLTRVSRDTRNLQNLDAAAIAHFNGVMSTCLYAHGCAHAFCNGYDAPTRSEAVVASSVGAQWGPLAAGPRGGLLRLRHPLSVAAWADH